MPSNRAFLRKITELGLDPKTPYIPGPNGIPVPKTNSKNPNILNTVNIQSELKKEEISDTKIETAEPVIENLIVENEITNEIIEQIQETENLPSLIEGPQEEVQQPKKKNNPFKKKTVNQE